MDPNTACIACVLQSSPATVNLCDTCQQGFHLGCFGLPSIPVEWVCQGCKQLDVLVVGQHVVLEMAQAVYINDDDARPTQGLFKESITVLGDINLRMLPPCREVQVSHLRQVGGRRPHTGQSHVLLPCHLENLDKFGQIWTVLKESSQLAEQLYQCNTSKLTSVILSSSHWAMFRFPAAAAGNALEVWVSGPDAAQRALQGLQQPHKQLCLLKSSSRPAEGSTRTSRVVAGQQQRRAQGRHNKTQAQSAHLPLAQQSQVLRPIQPQPAESQQRKPKAQHHPPAQASGLIPSNNSLATCQACTMDPAWNSAVCSTSSNADSG